MDKTRKAAILEHRQRHSEQNQQSSSGPIEGISLYIR